MDQGCADRAWGSLLNMIKSGSVWTPRTNVKFCKGRRGQNEVFVLCRVWTVKIAFRWESGRFYTYLPLHTWRQHYKWHQHQSLFSLTYSLPNKLFWSLFYIVPWLTFSTQLISTLFKSQYTSQHLHRFISHTSILQHFILYLISKMQHCLMSLIPCKM